MNKYYISKGLKKIGPISIDELNSQNINSKTLIWKEGDSDWKTAENFTELKEIIKVSPPSRGLKNIRLNNIFKSFLLSFSISAFMCIALSQTAIEAIIFKIQHKEQLNSSNADDQLEYLMRKDFSSFIVYYTDRNTSNYQDFTRIKVNETLDKVIDETIFTHALPISGVIFIVTFLFFCLPISQYLNYLRSLYK